MSGWAVVKLVDSEEDAEAFGPFTSRQRAERFCEDFGEYVNPGYDYIVVELYPVRGGERQIRDERAQEEGRS